jgi:transcriptional regulator with XRE-family HTH domain
MEPTRDEIRNWLQAILDTSGETPSALARRAGLATTTVTRFLNDPKADMIGLKSLAKIAHVAGVPPIGLPLPETAPAPRPPGLNDGDGVPFRTYPQKSGKEAAVAAVIGGRNAVDPWVLTSAALTAIGYLPGDILAVDLNRQPAAGDVVCAQVYNWQAHTAETVFRIYEPPFLLAQPLDAELLRRLRRPLVVDNDRVIIKGVVEASLRFAH